MATERRDPAEAAAAQLAAALKGITAELDQMHDRLDRLEAAVRNIDGRVADAEGL